MTTTTIEQPDSPKEDRADSPRPSRLSWLWGVLLGLGFLARLFWGFDADELQNLHYAWNIGQGMVPFRDFFEHHPPLLHYGLAPFVKGLATPSVGLLIATRAVAVVVAVLLAHRFHGLLRDRVPPRAALFGVGALMAVHPFGTSIFELRADWIALWLLLVAVGGLTSGPTRAGRGYLRSAFTAGLLVGVGLCLTQKTGFLLAGFLLWLGGTVVCAPDRAARARRLGGLIVFGGSALLPTALMLLAFARQGMGDLFLEYTLRINMRWASEGTWLYTAQESIPTVYPLFVVGVAAVLKGIPRLRAHLAAASRESLVSALLLFGLVVMARTPAPHPQAFLFLVAPWAIFLGVRAASFYAENPARIKADHWPLVIGGALCLAPLYWTNLAITLVVWGVLLALSGRRILAQASPHRRLSGLFALLLAPGLIAYAARAVDAFRLHEGSAQREFIAFVEGHAQPSEPILETWPLVTPFHPQPTFHGFARVGPAQTIGIERLEREYIDAVRGGKVRLIVVDDKDVRRQLPGFGRFLDAECHRVPGAPKTRDRLELYEYPKAPTSR